MLFKGLEEKNETIEASSAELAVEKLTGQKVSRTGRNGQEIAYVRERLASVEMPVPFYPVD